jgi:predicted nucleic acid-binding protein
MSYLIDTNVISEIVRPKPNHKVLNWFETIPNQSIYISVLTLGEIRKGIEKIELRQRKEKLKLWLENELPTWFENRILPIDAQIADRWGQLQAQAKHLLPAIDSLIAATALNHNLCIVTRNEQDFKFPLLQVVNPWNL